MAVCFKCSGDMDASVLKLVCAECKGVFHVDCVPPDSHDSYKKLSSRKKSSWRCDGCTAETSSTVSHESRSESEPSLSVLMVAFQNLGKSLEGKILDLKSSVDGVQKQLEGVNTTIGVIQSAVNILVTENDLRKEEYAKIVAENSDLRLRTSNLQMQVRELEQYSRKDNVEIVGVPLSRGENPYSILGRLSKVLKLEFDARDVSMCHRLPRREGQEHPNIIARFISREMKSSWVRAARENRARLTAALLSDTWPSTNIYINDHLTPHNKMVLSRAKRLVREKRLAYVWTSDCRILARKTALPDCPHTLIRSVEDLDRLIG